MRPQILYLLITVLLTVVFGKPAIQLLRRLKFGQSERAEGPQSHLKKQGTPTMGGAFFLLALLISGAIACVFYTDMLPLLLVTVAMGIVGLIDDLIKIKVDKHGLRAWQKSLLQLIFAAAYVGWSMWQLNGTYGIDLLFFTWNMPGWLYAVIMLAFFYYITNCVNLTDGVDGLASSTVGVAAFALAFAFEFALGDTTASIFSSMILAVCVGFLVYNRHPAKVFMGDTGSLALGAAFSALMMRTGTPVLALLIGLIFVVEGLSVMIQVVVFKATGKRVFRMTPIHHHFELGKWSETKIVNVFSLVTLLGAAATVAILYYF